MDTTAPTESDRDAEAQHLLDQLGSVDAADAPAVADELAGLLSKSIDGSPTQLAAEFDSGAGR